ncbi:phosphatase [Echinicola pacifica]|uniref:Phosphatase n=1 Tax=Echinicola pacifica TaxID=346377 RepID=A0A918UJ53_9BACT|nr:phosphonatase-like hydrolase [Echinicola pacifica]GGZ14016.1 phosphatase [Echinicola pacifica]
MKSIKLAVFDMAGTSVDEDNVVYKTVHQVILDLGYKVTLEEVLKHGAGKEKLQAITDTLAACTDSTEIEEEAKHAFANFKPSLIEAYETLNVKTFEGVEELFEALHKAGIKVVLNTGYDQRIAEMLVKKLGWEVGKQIDGLVTSDQVERGRPHPDMILKAMELTQIEDPKLVLKAGDSAIDIEEAKAAGCGLSVGVLSGAQTRDQLALAKPDYILETITELRALLI